MALPAALRIGDQLILEEDYDESYVPSEREIAEFARMIGIDAEKEPELLWLAREGIVAPLPAEWKPCQDVTGDIYYFNFADGRSTWEHPCDEHYRQLVALEREKRVEAAGGGGGGRRKERRAKRKEKRKELQPESMLLPSASFYRAPSPVSSSGRASPDLEPQGSLMVRHEPFLKSPKGRASGMPPEPSDLPGLLPACASGKLQPLLPAKPSRTHQILADVEKILGRAPSSSRHILGHQPRQDMTAEVRSAAPAVFSDSEPEDLDSLGGAQHHFKQLKEPSQGVQSDNCVLALGGAIVESLFLVDEELQEQGDSPLEGSRCFQGPVDTSLEERAVGATNSCFVKDGGFLHAMEKKTQLLPTAASLEPLCQMSGTSTLEGQGDVHSLGNRLRPLNSRKESRRRKKHLVQRQTTEFSRSGRETEGAAPEPDPLLQTCPGLGARAGTGVDASPLPATAMPRGEDIPSAKLDSADGGSSVASSLADHLASQILGEVDNFSWDLQSSHETDHPVDQLAASKRPFLEALHSQTHSSADDCSESECYSEDQKFYQHVLHMVKRSRGAELSAPESLKRWPGVGQNMEPNVTQEGSREAEAKAQTPQSLGEGQGYSTVPDGPAEGEPAQRRRLAENSSMLGLSPEGDQEKESPDPTAPLEGLAPFHGIVGAASGILQDALIPEGRSSVEGRDLTQPDSSRKNSRELVDEAVAAASPLNPLMPVGAEEEEAVSESLGRTAQLLTEPPHGRSVPALQTCCALLSSAGGRLLGAEGWPEQGLQLEEEHETRDHKAERRRSSESELGNAKQKEELLQQEEVALKELQKLSAQLRFEMEAEKERMRLAHEAAFYELREELEALRRSEEEGLREQERLSLERMKQETEAAQRAKQMELEQDSRRALEELKERLCREKESAMQELEAQFAAETEQQRAAAQEEHQKALSALRIEIAEAQRKEEVGLRKELKSTEQQVQQKRLQVAEYERELSDLLREKRQEVEQEHARQLEKMQEAHQETLAAIQLQYEEEERRQRMELQGHCQEERTRQGAELEALRRKQAEELKGLHRIHQEEEQKARDAALELELRARDAQARAAQLQAQEEVWKKRKQQLLEEEKQLEQQQNEAALAAHLSLEESRKEQESLAETTRQLRQILAELQDQKAELGAQVEQLQLQRQKLQGQASELEEAIKRKQELLNLCEGESHEPSPRKKEEPLRVEDLQESNSAPSSREMTSEVPKNDEESRLLLDQVRHYISAEGSSLKTTKEFLVHQTHSVRKRQAVLRAAKQHWSHDLQDAGHSQALERVRRNLEQEAKQLDEAKSAVRRGQVLLRKKEERLAQLESSLREELSDEDTLKGVACKKVVAFALNDSEDTSSEMSTEGSPHKTVDLKPELYLPPLDKIQCLTDSLQRITSELDRVLGLLSTFSAQQPLLFVPTKGPASPLPTEGLPLPAYPSVARAQHAAPGGPPAGPQWAWGLCSGSSSSALAGRSVDSMLTEKWHKYFPGGFPLPCRGPGPMSSRLTFVAPDDHRRFFPHPHFQGSEAEKLSIQGMIDANRKWLESVKQDSRAPLLPSGPNPSLRAPAVVQLSLDENNQIKVYHF
ncbi:centrosomal protein of 164 kDa [Sceloporus undulatus]|uniref:centrosomal protein of 164 kDa n=1 Tax=Sceloporus undulatus TaxID=8520 RepID=UPI001C4B2D4D|nr:centrosomal protein of 164 kDa [Sceloporus undulatus]